MSNRLWLIRPTRLTEVGAAVIVATILACAMFLLVYYPALPDILPVHFNRASWANGWQFKTYPRVFMPVLVQVALAVVFGAVSMLLLSRPRAASEDENAADVRAASVAAEAVALFAAIWVVFQAYAACALVIMWQRGRGGLGDSYTAVMVGGVVLSFNVAVRAHGRLGRPAPRAFVAEHWRFGQLYSNASDPALFAPTRSGSGWTLNFGRPVAAALTGLVLALGVVLPTLLLLLLLR